MNTKYLATAAAFALATAGCATYGDSTMDDDMDMATDTTATTSTTTRSTGASTSTQVMVGGAAMLPSRTIVANASEASNLTTLVQLVQAANLVDTLNGPGPFTVFAPTNDAFSRVSQAARDKLTMPENQATLRQVLTYHVVPGRLTGADLMERIRAGGGSAMLTTVQGETLTATVVNGDIKLAGSKGSLGYVQQADVMQSNGVVHTVNGVLLPDVPI